MILGSRTKDPADARTYKIDWSAWLTSINNDTIATPAWSVPAGLTLGSSSNTTTTTQARISGGVAQTTYTVYCTVTTAAGEIRKVGFNVTAVTP